jgi:Rad3-related DNA helicase
MGTHTHTSIHHLCGGPDPSAPSGRYVQQGLRAVNQAMGRVIRHRWDYGAVLLADERFAAPANQRHLSRWLRERVTRHGSFGAAIASLTHFFKVCC